MRKANFALGLVLAGAAAQFGCSNMTKSGQVQSAPPPPAQPEPTTTPSSAPQATDHVKIDDFNFLPQAIVVSPGTKVTWVNKDGSRHTVTSDDGKFDSGPLGQNQEFSYTFTDPGTYAYHCGIHKAMTGQVIVK